MTRGAAVIVHGLAQARDALAVATALGSPLALLSAPGAAGYGGIGWWLGLTRAAREAYPAATGCDILDCDDLAGTAAEALRAGCRMVVFTGPDAQAARLIGIAAACGAVLLRAPPPSLDLGHPGAARHLADWIAGRGPA